MIHAQVLRDGMAHAVRAPRPLILVENHVLAAVFAVTVALPLAEMALRSFLGAGIRGVGAIVQHLTLALGMLGAAVAARDGRLLTLAVAGFVKGSAAVAARFAGGVPVPPE